MKTSLVPRYVDAQTTENQERKAQATLEDGLAKIRALVQLEITPEKRTWTQQERKIEYRSITDGRNQEQIYRASLQAEGRTRRDVVIWVDIAGDTYKSNDSRYSHPKAEKVASRRGTRSLTSTNLGKLQGQEIVQNVARNTAHQGTVSRTGELVAGKTQEDEPSLLGKRKEKSADTHASTYTDAEWRQWRSQPHSSSSSSSWAWSTWQWHGYGQLSKSLNLFLLCSAGLQSSKHILVSGRWEHIPTWRQSTTAHLFVHIFSVHSNMFFSVQMFSQVCVGSLSSV